MKTVLVKPEINELNNSDTTYQAIMQELSINTCSKRGGRPILLSWKTYVEIIRNLEYGQTFENIINTGIIKRNAFYDYRRKSNTFSNATDSARATTSRAAVISLAMAVRYIPEHYKTIKDSNGNEISIFIPEHKPDLAVCRWWLTHDSITRARFNRHID